MRLTTSGIFAHETLSVTRSSDLRRMDLNPIDEDLAFLLIFSLPFVDFPGNPLVVSRLGMLSQPPLFEFLRVHCTAISP